MVRLVTMRKAKVAIDVRLKRINPDDRSQMHRLMKIESSRQAKKWMVGDSWDHRSWREYIKQSNRERDVIVWGVFGGSSHVFHERGKLQGWVQFYPDEHKFKLLEKKPALEVSFAKVPGRMPHQMSKAVEKACKKLIVKKIRGRKPVITAYTSEKNVRSRILLENCGFKRKASVKYDQESLTRDHLYIFG